MLKARCSDGGQPDLPFPFPQQWSVQFSYEKYTRKFGVCVRQQFRTVQKFQALTREEAIKAAKRWHGDLFLAEHKRIGGDIAKLLEGESITRYGIFNLKSCELV